MAGTPQKASPKKDKLEQLNGEIAEFQGQLDVATQEATASQKKMDEYKVYFDATMTGISDERKKWSAVLTEAKFFNDQATKAQGQILHDMDEECKKLEEAAEAARKQEEDAKVTEKEALQKVAECAAERDSTVTDYEQDAKAYEEGIKTAQADAAEKVQKLEVAARGRMEKLVQEIEKARKQLDDEVDASKAAEQQRADAVAEELKKRREGLAGQHAKAKAAQEERNRLMPQIKDMCNQRQEFEKEYTLLSGRYAEVDYKGTCDEHKLLAEITALEERLTAAKKPSDQELKLIEEFKAHERQLVDGKLTRDIEDARLRSEVEELDNSHASTLEEIAKETAACRLEIAESRDAYSSALNKAGAQQTKLRTATVKAKEMRKEADDLLMELRTDLNAAKAKLLVHEIEGVPAAKKAKKGK